MREVPLQGGTRPTPPQRLRCRRTLISGRANMAHTRQSRPDSGLVFQVHVLTTFKVFPPRAAAVGQVSAQSRQARQPEQSAPPSACV